VHSGPLKLFRNDTPRVGRWLQLELGGGAGSRCAPHGIGAVVECEALDGDAVEVMRRWVHSGSGYQSSSEPVVHLGFGVGNLPPDGSKRGGSARVRVLWPSGQTTVRDGVALDSRVAIAAPARADVDGDGTVGAGDLSAIMAAWGGMDRAQRSVRAADIDGDGVIDARDVLEVLSGWTH
jgi:hypothetical protein